MKKDSRELKKTIYYFILVIGWAVLALIASQFIIAILMSCLVGDKFSEPFWMMIYYALNYSLTLALVLFVLPRLVNLYSRRREQKLAKDETIDIERPNEYSAEVEEIGIKRRPN